MYARDKEKALLVCKIFLNFPWNNHWFDFRCVATYKVIHFAVQQDEKRNNHHPTLKEHKARVWCKWVYVMRWISCFLPFCQKNECKCQRTFGYIYIIWKCNQRELLVLTYDGRIARIIETLFRKPIHMFAAAVFIPLFNVFHEFVFVIKLVNYGVENFLNIFIHFCLFFLIFYEFSWYNIFISGNLYR